MDPKRKSPTNVDIAVLALAQLGGATRKVHSEEVAVRAFELAPEKFSWRLPQYRTRGWPDKETVRAALVNARAMDHGRLVRGDYATDLSKDGWTLTAAGSAWITANETRILAGLSAEKSEIPRQEAQRFCKKLRGESLYREFLENGNVDSASPYHFTDLLECSPDAPRETIQTKFDRLRAIAHVVKDEKILSFLDACSLRFSKLLGTLREAERPNASNLVGG